MYVINTIEIFFLCLFLHCRPIKKNLKLNMVNKSLLQSSRYQSDHGSLWILFQDYFAKLICYKHKNSWCQLVVDKLGIKRWTSNV
jgi:hypothetical protein